MSVIPSGKDVVVIESGEMVTLMLNGTEAVRGGVAESATCTVNFEVPPAQAVPEIVPSLPKENPVGSDPEVTLQENGPRPPDSCSVALYAPPPVPPGKEVVVTEGGGTTVSDAGIDFVLSATEVATTCTEREAVIGLGAV